MFGKNLESKMAEQAEPNRPSFRSFDSVMKERFGSKVYKLSLDGGFTCPNRDGTLGTGGCIFCLDGSRDFSVSVTNDMDVQIERAKDLVRRKNPDGQYIAYFQSYTGTYASKDRLFELYNTVLQRDDICALDIATRPDCLPDDILTMLTELNRIKPVWIELGLQTIHEKTAEYIRRGYPLSVFDDAVGRLRRAKLETIVHMIIGLPGEQAEEAAETAEYIGRSGAQGIKFQLLHVLRGTDLETDFTAGRFSLPELDEYISILEECLRRIPPEMVVHRLTGDGAKRDLIAPLWSADKKNVLNTIRRRFSDDYLVQGEKFIP